MTLIRKSYRRSGRKSRKPDVEIALRLIESCPDSVILFVSSTPVSGWTTDELATLDRLPPGSFEILEKPFTPTALEEKVRGLVNQRFKNQSGASGNL
jgi:hypothetical protein